MKKHLFLFVIFALISGASFSQTFNETEPNDSFEQADLVTLPTTVITSMGNDDDVDFFKLDLLAAGVVTVKLSEVPSGQLIRLYAYNSEHTQIAYTVSPENGVGFEYDILLPVGVSYIKVYDYRGEVSSHAFQMELVLDSSDACEDNNSFETACLISPDITLHPQIFGENTSLGGDDVDYYMLDLPVAGVVTFNLSNLAPGQLIRMYAYDSEHSQIAYTVSPENGIGFEYDILFPSGVSYFMLYDYRALSDSIHLDLNLNFDVTDICEENNSFATACLISPDITIHPQIFGENTSLGGDDVDYYMLDLPVAGVVTFNLSNLAPGQLIRMYAYDSEHSQIAHIVSPENGIGFEYDILFPSGVSYFKLYDYRALSDSIHLDLDLSFEDTDGCEINNSFATACIIPPRTTIYPKLYGYNSSLGGHDVDYFKILSANCMNQCISISDVQESQLIRLYVYDEAKNQVGYAMSPGDGVGFDYCVDLESGAYYVEIVDYRSSSNAKAITVDFSGASLALKPEISQVGDNLQCSSASAYQWYLDGEIMDGATNQIITPEKSGVYNVVITNAVGCNNVSDPFQFYLTGISNTTLDESVTVFPNPSNGEFTVFFPMSTKQVQILNSIGQVLQTDWIKQEISQEYILQRKGIYFIRIKTDKETITRKLIVTN